MQDRMQQAVTAMKVAARFCEPHRWKVALYCTSILLRADNQAWTDDGVFASGQALAARDSIESIERKDAECEVVLEQADLGVGRCQVEQPIQEIASSPR